MKKAMIFFHTFILCMTITSSSILATSPDLGIPSLPAQTGKMYGIGSVSKVVTAAAVMKLVDGGLLDLDTAIINYIPDFSMADERYLLITPRMLLNHSSGLMGMTDNNAILYGDNDTYNHDNFLDFLKMQSIKHEPGDRSIYSNDSFTLAEILIEQISGMSFTDFIEQNFFTSLKLENIKTPQSDFDRNRLTGTYLGNSELKTQNFNVIGSGGIYSTMEDLCRYATIFMDSADDSVLSKESVKEMAKVQHKMELVAPDADTVGRYGLGWDCVEQYPFNQLGIQALSKGGGTEAYFTMLTVLPEYNMAAAVATSGAGGLEGVVAQQILLAVLEEEGLIPPGTAFALPELNLNGAQIPDDIITRAGIYDAGMGGLYDLSFTADSLILTPLGIRNERPMKFIFNTDGTFSSTDGDFLGIYGFMTAGAVGLTELSFADKYLLIKTYTDIPGLGKIAEAMPFAEKIEANPVPQAAQDAWNARKNREYLLISEKYTSGRYMNSALAKITTDERLPGYVIQGIYRGSGRLITPTRITDENNTKGYQDSPTVMGRDIINLTITGQGGTEYLHINNFRYIDATTAISFSDIGNKITIGNEPVWVDIDGFWDGKTIIIETPEKGSWFIYDDKMNCITTSLEKNARRSMILPEGGRVMFAGEPGVTFMVQ